MSQAGLLLSAQPAFPMQAWTAAKPTVRGSPVARTQPQLIAQAGRVSQSPVGMSACCSSPSAALRPARRARAISRRVTAIAAAAQQPPTGRPAASHRRIPPAAAAGEHAADNTAASRRAALVAVVAGIAAVGAQPAAADENVPRQGEVRRGRARQANVQSLCALERQQQLRAVPPHAPLLHLLPLLNSFVHTHRSSQVRHTDAEWRRLLPADAYAVLRQAQTERRFTSPLVNVRRWGGMLWHCRQPRPFLQYDGSVTFNMLLRPRWQALLLPWCSSGRLSNRHSTLPHTRTNPAVWRCPLPCAGEAGRHLLLRRLRPAAVC